MDSETMDSEMDKKKWTDGERDEAFDRGMETMQRVALELYRRGREPLLEEIETVKRERDEARAEVERLRAQYAATVLEHGKMLIEAVDSAKRQKSLADRAHDQACRLAAKVDAQSTDQFRRGAEAMREACQQWCRAWENNGEAIADALADLRVEDKP